MATAHAPFRSLPDDVLQRLLVGLPLEDHRAAASVCKAFRDVINGPRFLALRKRYGFAEHSIVTVAYVIPPISVVRSNVQSVYNARIRVAHSTTGGTANINGYSVMSYTESTTDRGSRLFVGTSQPGATPSQILAVDVSSRRWRPFATLPRNQHLHCMEWHGGLLYVAGGTEGGPHGGQSDSLHAFNEATGLWDNSLPPMPHPCMAATSGIIGNELFIAGGFDKSHPSEGYLRTLQIYDIAAKTWRVGAPLPEAHNVVFCVVLDGKLFVVSARRGANISVYEPQSNSWTEEPGFPTEMGRAVKAFAHDGRLTVLGETGATFWRTSDGLTWLRYDSAEPPPEELAQAGRNGHGSLAAGSLLLG